MYMTLGKMTEPIMTISMIIKIILSEEDDDGRNICRMSVNCSFSKVSSKSCSQGKSDDPLNPFYMSCLCSWKIYLYLNNSHKQIIYRHSRIQRLVTLNALCCISRELTGGFE